MIFLFILCAWVVCIHIHLRTTFMPAAWGRELQAILWVPEIEPRS